MPVALSTAPPNIEERLPVALFSRPPLNLGVFWGASARVVGVPMVVSAGPPCPALERTGNNWAAASRQSDLRDQWELADADPAGLDDYDAAVREVALDRREIGKQRLRLLLGSSLRVVTKQHNRW
jgi:hypothetical protein